MAEREDAGRHRLEELALPHLKSLYGGVQGDAYRGEEGLRSQRLDALPTLRSGLHRVPSARDAPAPTRRACVLDRRYRRQTEIGAAPVMRKAGSDQCSPTKEESE